jgi:hypothetical protein
MLSPAELSQFVTEGYVTCPALLPPELCAAARDRLWAVNTLPRLRRDSPASWTGPFAADEINEDASDHRSGFRWGARSIGKDTELLDLLPRNPVVLSIVDQLLGPGRWVCSGAQHGQTRGVYCTLPYGDEASPRSDSAKCHVDSALGDSNRIGAIAYIADVPPSGGSFSVWPRSHLRVNNLMNDQPTSARLSAERGALGILDQPQTRPAREGEAETAIPGLVGRVLLETEPGDLTQTIAGQGVDPNGGIRAGANSHPFLLRSFLIPNNCTICQDGLGTRIRNVREQTVVFFCCVHIDMYSHVLFDAVPGGS